MIFKRHERKFSNGRINGGPLSIFGCCLTYILKTSFAVDLFCKQSNLQTEKY